MIPCWTLDPRSKYDIYGKKLTVDELVAPAVSSTITATDDLRAPVISQVPVPVSLTPPPALSVPQGNLDVLYYKRMRNNLPRPPGPSWTFATQGNTPVQVISLPNLEASASGTRYRITFQTFFKVTAAGLGTESLNMEHSLALAGLDLDSQYGGISTQYVCAGVMKNGTVTSQITNWDILAVNPVNSLALRWASTDAFGTPPPEYDVSWEVTIYKSPHIGTYQY